MAKRTNIGGLLLASLLCVVPCAPGFGQSLDLASTRISRSQSFLRREHDLLANVAVWFRVEAVTQGHDERRLLLFHEYILFARARRHAFGRTDAFRRRSLDKFRHPPERFIGPAVVIDISDKTAANSDYMYPRRYRRLGGRAWPNCRWRHRAAADGVERALARQENLSRRRHARRRVPPAFSFLWAGGRGAARERAPRPYDWRRHRQRGLRSVPRLSRPPHRGRGERQRPGKSDKPRSASADRQHRCRAADQDRRRIGRAGADYRACAEVGDRALGLQNETTGRITQT